VVRYVGKGRNGRIYSHLIDAKRTASRSDVKISNLSPHFRKMLVSAVRRGSNIVEKMVASNITDGEAYTMERQMIGNYHKRHAGQLWNTIDERFMDPKHLPKKWANPVNPLYRLSRPLNDLLDRSMAVQQAMHLQRNLNNGDRWVRYFSKSTLKLCLEDNGEKLKGRKRDQRLRRTTNSDRLIKPAC
jgi:hypothetical protein